MADRATDGVRGSMVSLSRMMVWASRFALAVGAFDFGSTAYTSLLEPVMMAWNKGIGMWTPTAISTARVQFGVYPLAVAATALICLAAPRRHLFGLGLLLVVSAATLAGYGAGLVLEGTSTRSLLLAQREMLTTAIYVLGFAIEWRRRHTSLAPA